MGFIKHSRAKNIAFPQTSVSSSANLQSNEDGHIKPSGCELHHTAASLIWELEMNAAE